MGIHCDFFWSGHEIDNGYSDNVGEFCQNEVKFHFCHLFSPKLDISLKLNRGQNYCKRTQTGIPIGLLAT